MEISPPKAFIILGMASERGLIHINALASASQNGVGQECLPKNSNFWCRPGLRPVKNDNDNDNNNDNDNDEDSNNNDNDNNENSVNMQKVTEQDCLHPEQCSIV